MEHDQPKPDEAKFSGADLANELITGMPEHLKNDSAEAGDAKKPEAINAPKEHGKVFESEMPVAVLRTSGALEYDWKVGAFDEEGNPADPVGPDGKINVYRLEPNGQLAEKRVGFDALSSWQPKFSPDQHVRVDSESAGPDGWQVASQLPNGEVNVVKPTGDGKIWRKFLPAVELLRMQQPSYELTDAEKADPDINGHRQRITIVRGAQDRPAEEPKRGLGRLFRRG